WLPLRRSSRAIGTQELSASCEHVQTSLRDYHGRDSSPAAIQYGEDSVQLLDFRRPRLAGYRSGVVCSVLATARSAVHGGCDRCNSRGTDPWSGTGKGGLPPACHHCGGNGLNRNHRAVFPGERFVAGGDLRVAWPLCLCGEAFGWLSSLC